MCIDINIYIYIHLYAYVYISEDGCRMVTIATDTPGTLNKFKQIN
jgi:hypothetical protein